MFLGLKFTEYPPKSLYRVDKKKRAAWLDHGCSLKIQYFSKILHMQFVQYLLNAVRNVEGDIKKTVKMVLIVKQQIFGLLCRFALQCLDEGCRLMHIATYTMHPY